MIEGNTFPALLGMAALALGAKFSLVPFFLVIVLLVAGDALLLELILVQVTLVAFGTLDFLVLAQQRILGLLVVIENALFPALLVVASLALGTEFALVPLLSVIVLLVTVVAQLGRVLVLVVDMALCTFHLFVLVKQFELGLAVVEMQGLPVFFLMAILAFWPETAFMLVSLFMAVVALCRRIPIFLLRQVTILAQHLAVQVGAFQNIAGFRVIKADGNQLYYARIPTFMIGMALLAGFLFLQQAVIAFSVGYILGHFLVAILAQLRLRRLVIRLVAIIAIAFVFLMSRDHLARHQ